MQSTTTILIEAPLLLTKTDHYSSTLSTISCLIDLPPAVQVTNALERCTIPGSRAASCDLASLQRALAFMVLASRLAASYIRSMGTSISQHQTSYDMAKAQSHNTGGSGILPKSTFSCNTLDWYNTCYCLIQEADSSKPKELFSATFASNAVFQFILEALRQAHGDKVRRALLHDADMMSKHYNHIALCPSEMATQPLPSTPSRTKSALHQVYLGDVILYKNIKYEVIDEITSSRHGTKYVIANVADHSVEKTLAKSQIKEMFNDGAVIITLEYENKQDLNRVD